MQNPHKHAAVIRRAERPLSRNRFSARAKAGPKIQPSSGIDSALSEPRDTRATISFAEFQLSQMHASTEPPHIDFLIASCGTVQQRLTRGNAYLTDVTIPTISSTHVQPVPANFAHIPSTMCKTNRKKTRKNFCSGVQVRLWSISSDTTVCYGYFMRDNRPAPNT